MSEELRESREEQAEVQERLLSSTIQLTWSMGQQKDITENAAKSSESMVKQTQLIAEGFKDLAHGLAGLIVGVKDIFKVVAKGKIANTEYAKSVRNITGWARNAIKLTNDLDASYISLNTSMKKNKEEVALLSDYIRKFNKSIGKGIIGIGNAAGNTITRIGKLALNIRHLKTSLLKTPQKIRLLGSRLKKFGFSINKIAGGMTKKFFKGITDTREMFKEMKGAAVNAWKMQQMMKLIEPFILLLKPLEPLFTILGGLFKMVAAEAIKPMLAFLEPLFDIMMDMAPFFKALGTIIGQLLTIALIPLKVIFQVIAAVVKPLTPLLEGLGDILIMLSPAIDFLTEIITQGLMWAIWAISYGIAKFVDLITWIIDAIDFLNITPIRATDYGSAVDAMLRPMATGGHVPATPGGTAVLLGEGGQGETVTPDDKFDDLIYEMQLSNAYNRENLRMQKNKRMRI